MNAPYRMIRVAQLEGQIVEVRLSEDRRDDLHEDVVGERVHDRGERGTDDDGDGEVDDVASHDEVLEFLEHQRLPIGPESLAGRVSAWFCILRSWPMVT